MKTIYYLIWIFFLPTPILHAQTFDIKFIIGEDSEVPHFYSITPDSTILVANTSVDASNNFGQLQIVRLDSSI